MITLAQFTPLVLFPYAIAALFVICYFIYLKCMIRIKIKSMHYSQSGQLQSLKIKSTIYNFILTLCISEFVANIGLNASEIQIYYFSSAHSIQISNTCEIRDVYLLFLSDESTFYTSRIRSIGLNIWAMIPIITSLFFVILRRLYINYPYRQHIQKYIVYILFEYLVKTITSFFIHTGYFTLLLYFPFLVIDISIYTSTSHKFYCLLKGNRNASRLHASAYTYAENKRIVNHFFYAQIYMLFIFSISLCLAFSTFLSVPLSIIAFNPCFLSYASLGLFPIITVTQHIQAVSVSLLTYLTRVELTCSVIAEMFIIVFYLVMSYRITSSLVKARRRNTQSTEWITRPLMEKYRRGLLNK